MNIQIIKITKKIHEGFKAVVKDTVDDYYSSANITSLMKLNKMITGWLIEHIKKRGSEIGCSY